MVRNIVLTSTSNDTVFETIAQALLDQYYDVHIRRNSKPRPQHQTQWGITAANDSYFDGQDCFVEPAYDEDQERCFVVDEAVGEAEATQLDVAETMGKYWPEEQHDEY